MKKLFALLVLFVSACQPQAAPGTAATRTPTAVPADITHVSASDTAIVALSPLFTPADTLTASMRAVLRAHDLSALWGNKEASEGLYPNPTLNGFFGADHYHFAMVFNEVTCDPTNPARYFVRGKCNYYKSRNVRPFTGTLTVRQLNDLNYPGFLRQHAQQYADAADTLEGRLYTARAQLQLRETPQPNSGILEGEVLLDFYVLHSHSPDYVYVFNHEGYDDQLPTRGGKLLVRGNRLNVTTGQLKPFLVGPELGAVAPHIFKDFMFDERMGHINPKYDKLGWNTYWENDEWWADSPKPRLSL